MRNDAVFKKNVHFQLKNIGKMCEITLWWIQIMKKRLFFLTSTKV